MKPHRTDGVSLSFGTVFLLIAVWWAVSQVVSIGLPMLGWMVAGVLILFGVVGLLGAIRPRRAEVRPPVRAEAVVETPGGLPPQMHAEIVQELLDDPATRFQRAHPHTTEAPQAAQPAPQPAPQAPQPAPQAPSDEPPGQPRRD